MADDYPLLRASLAPQYAGLPAPQLQGIVQAIYGPGATPEDVESLFDDIGSGLRHAAGGIGHFAQQAVPVVTHALPAMMSGASAGMAAGPWGALIGGAAGLTGGILSQSHNHTAQTIGNTIQGASSLVSTVRGTGAAGGLGSLASVAGGLLGQTSAGRAAAGMMGASNGGGAGGAVNALLGLLGRPELAGALSSAAMGSAGATNIPIGGQSVPVSQLLAALGVLGQRAAHEAAEFEEDAARTPAYARAAGEALGIDSDDAEGRTDALLTLLALTPSIWATSRSAAPVSVSVATSAPGANAGYDVGEQFWLEAPDEWSDENFVEWDEEEPLYA